MSERVKCPHCGCRTEDPLGGPCRACWDMPSTMEQEEWDDDDEGPDCHWCEGEGWQDCPDPLQCTRKHNRLGECRCSSCGGSGLRKDMTIW